MRVKITRVEIVEVYFRPPDEADDLQPNINLDDLLGKVQDDILNSQDEGAHVGINLDYWAIPKELVELKVEEVP